MRGIWWAACGHGTPSGVQSPASRAEADRKDFGICAGCLHNWMKKADVEDGHCPGVTDADRVELRDLKKRNKLLEQENEVLRRAAARGRTESVGADRWAISGGRGDRDPVGTGGVGEAVVVRHEEVETVTQTEGAGQVNRVE